MRLHRFSSESVLQVLHTNVLSILTRVPEVQSYVIDCCSTNITVERESKVE